MDTVGMAILISLLGAYVVVSVTLFCFPQLLHKKKKHGFHPVHISHRGGAGENIENTMVAFEQSLAVGTDMLELDVHLSKDGQVVVVHDGELSRLCNDASHVADHNYADLPALRSIMRVVFSPTLPAATSPAPLRMPLLREVFERHPTVPINVDIKADSDALIDATANLIEEFKRQDRTVIGSGWLSVSKRIQRRLPDTPRFFSGAAFLRYVLAFYLGLLPFINVSEDFLEIPLPWNLRQLSRSRSHRVVLWLLDTLCVNRAFLYHMRRRGVQILIWVLNDEDSIRRAFSLGATGVMTDYPTLLKKVLQDSELRSSIAKSSST